MPATDELLLKVIEEGAESVAKSADKIADSLDQVTKSQDKVADSAEKSSKGFKGLSVGMADLKAGLDMVVNVGGKVVDFLKDSVEGTVKYAAQVRDLSRAIGANAEESSALIQVADDVNVSVEELNLAFKGAIQKGIQPNIEGLARLSDEYNAISDPVQRSQFAISRFGEAGLKMAKILEQGGDAIRASAADAKKLGLTLDEVAVKQAREFEIQMDNLGDKVDALKLKVGKGLVPAINTFLDTMDQGTQVLDTMANGVGSINAKENELAATVARNVAFFGEYNAITQESIRALREYVTEIYRQDIVTSTAAQTEKEAAERSAAALKNKEKILKENADASYLLHQKIQDLTDKGFGPESVQIKLVNADLAQLQLEHDMLTGKVDASKVIFDGFKSTFEAFTNFVPQATIDQQAYENSVYSLSQKIQWLTDQGFGPESVQIQLVKKDLADLQIQHDMSKVAVSSSADAAQRHTEVMRDYANSLLLATQQAQAKKVADEEAAKADAIYRASVGETIAKVDSMAQSLAKATDAQATQMLAQASLDAIKKAYEEGTISQEGFNKATDAVLLRYDLATPKSLAMADAQKAINDALIAGNIPLDTYVKSIGNIPKVADDGKISMDDLTKLGIKPTTAATIEQRGQVDLLADAWMHVPREVTTNYTVTQTGTVPGRAYGGPVSAGLPYMVGERGPEMFVPSQSGSIQPNYTTNNYSTAYNVTTDRTGLAYMFERQRMAEAEM